MLRMILSATLVLTFMTSFQLASAEESECLKEGDSIAAFYVTKVAGAADDGVEEGEELCYRCKYGSRPMVLVFARETGGQVPQLIKELDAAVGANEEAKLKSVVTLLGDDASALEADGKKVVAATGAKHVPVTVAKDTKTGPASYRIPADADVTIVVASDSQVIGTHTFGADKIDIKALMSQVKGMLN